jgi:hypothetical protein
MAPVSERASVTYTAVCERVGDWWEVTVPELDEVTQARTLDDVPATVVDLVALMTDVDPAKVSVKVEAVTGPGLDIGKAALFAVGMIATAAVILSRTIVRALTRVPVR